MSHRLMSDRDHLVALTTAADLLLRHGSNCPQQDLLALQARLVAAVERAKQDLAPSRLSFVTAGDIHLNTCYSIEVKQSTYGNHFHRRRERCC